MFAVSRWLLALTGIVAATAAIEAALAQDSPHRQAFERCKAIDDDRLRLSCLRSIIQDNEAKDRDPRKRWRLVQTTDTEGGRKAVSIMQTADTSRSDPDLAGLMIRCGGKAGDDKTSFEVLVVLLNALPLRNRPNVWIKSANGESRFTASIAVPGPLVLLPPEATALANGTWQDLSEVFIEVEDAGRTVHGVVALADLRSALSNLSASCLRDTGLPQ
jgi:hypothetical protein